MTTVLVAVLAVAVGGVAGWLLNQQPVHENGNLHGAGEYRFRGVFYGQPRRALWDRAGVRWDQGPLPVRAHRCWAQTCELTIDGLHHTDRCACGGMRVGVFGAWQRRNSR